MTEYQDGTVPNRQYPNAPVPPALDRPCPTCKAKPGQDCHTPKAKRPTSTHLARMRR